MEDNVTIDATCLEQVLAPLKNRRWDYGGGYHMLESLAKRPDLLEGIDTVAGEEACVRAFFPVDGLPQSEPARERAADLRAVLGELCHYPPAARTTVIEAALSEDVAAINRRRNRTQTARRFKRALRSLSPKEKALLRVIDVLDCNYPEDVDLLNTKIQMLRNVSVKVLERDPRYADLMFVLQMARAAGDE